MIIINKKAIVYLYHCNNWRFSSPMKVLINVGILRTIHTCVQNSPVLGWGSLINKSCVEISKGVRKKWLKISIVCNMSMPKSQTARLWMRFTKKIIDIRRFKNNVILRSHKKFIWIIKNISYECFVGSIHSASCQNNVKRNYPTELHTCCHHCNLDVFHTTQIMLHHCKILCPIYF